MNFIALLWALSITDEDIKSTHKLVLIALASSTNNEFQCFLTVKELCENIKIQSRAFIRATELLVSKNMIKKNKHHGKQTSYELLIPRDFIDRCTKDTSVFNALVSLMHYFGLDQCTKDTTPVHERHCSDAKTSVLKTLVHDMHRSPNIEARANIDITTTTTKDINIKTSSSNYLINSYFKISNKNHIDEIQGIASDSNFTEELLMKYVECYVRHCDQLAKDKGINPSYHSGGFISYLKKQPAYVPHMPKLKKVAKLPKEVTEFQAIKNQIKSAELKAKTYPHLKCELEVKISELKQKLADLEDAGLTEAG